MLSEILSCSIAGINGFIVKAEADVSRGLPSFEIVGLPDAAVKESKERVRSAIRNSGFEMPVKKITVNLAPADIKKEGAIYDLPIAVGILLATETITQPNCADGYMFIGELSLSGEIRRVNGVLPMVDCARRMGIKKVVVPPENAREAAVAEGVEVYAPRTLNELFLHLTGTELLNRTESNIDECFKFTENSLPDFADVRGQENAKYGLEIAAAGGHNCLMIGPPGSGKTMLAQRIPSILPDLTVNEAIEITKIHSIAGELRGGISLMTTRPFRHPHHTVSSVRLVGGGAYPRPGEISLAHNGVLFLDEFPEFEKRAIDVMRQPLEDGIVTVSRVNGSVSYPCSTMLVASMNPCKCGHFGDPNKKCICTPTQRMRYMSRISGPMMDRIDIHLQVAQVKFDDMRSETHGESSSEIKKRVNSARQIQLERYKNEGIYSNSQMSAAQIERFCKIDSETSSILKTAFEKLAMSARGYSRILKVARTIADLHGTEDIKKEHVLQAISFRTLDRE